MDNYAKVDLYRIQAKRSRNQANANNDEGIRTIMSVLADEYDELANIYLRMVESDEKKHKTG